MQYWSIIKFLYNAMDLIEVSFGREVACSNGSVSLYSRKGEVYPIWKDVFLEGAQLEGSLSIVGNMLVRLAWSVGTRIVSYLALKCLHTSHKPKLSAWIS